MNTANDKVAGLLGFAVKSGNILFGLDRILSERKRLYLLILDTSAGENTSKGIKRISQEKGIPLLISKVLIEDLVCKKNCKTVAVTDANLARGIRENLNPNYIEVK